MKPCPNCGEGLKRNPRKFSIFPRLSISALGELGALILACALLVVVPALSFAVAFVLCLLVMIGSATYAISLFRGYKCAKCDKVFKKEDLQIV